MRGQARIHCCKCRGLAFQAVTRTVRVLSRGSYIRDNNRAVGRIRVLDRASSGFKVTVT